MSAWAKAERGAVEAASGVRAGGGALARVGWAARRRAAQGEGGSGRSGWAARRRKEKGGPVRGLKV